MLYQESRNFVSLRSKSTVIWIVKKRTTNHFATAPIHAAEKEYAAIASPITEKAVSYLPVIFQMM
ncbi:MAG: hypothetical protein WD577_01550 [Bacteroidales bacterium]